MSTKDSSPPSKPRFESIDGLRGLACLMVLLYHSCDLFGNIAWPTLSIGSFHLAQARFFAYGYGGVDLFFVLSGFCLAYPIVSRPERSVDWKQYAINRVRRIVPPFWAAMMLFACLSLWITHRAVQPFAASHILGWTGSHQIAYSILLISDSFNPSFWTLPVEWRWYFLLPCFIWLWRRIGGSGVLLCTIPVSLVSIFIYMPSHQQHLKFLITNLPTYMPLFGLGIWAASLVAGKARYPWERQLTRSAFVGSAVAVLIVILFAPLGMTAFTIKWSVLRLVTWGPLCFFLVLAATQEGHIQRVVSWCPLVWVGTFSYSLYLVHEPFLQMAAALILPHHWSTIPVLVCQIVVLPATLVGFGYLFFLAAEKPFLRRPVKRAIEAEQFGHAMAKVEGIGTSHSEWLHSLIPTPQTKGTNMNLSVKFGKFCANNNVAEKCTVWLGHHFPGWKVTRSLCYHTGEGVSAETAGCYRVAVLLNGARMGVTLDEHSFRQIYFYGTYEPEVTALMYHLAGPGQVWLDVGANIGYYTILLASLVGPMGEVHAFEPNPDMAKQITNSLSMNGFQQVQKIELAVSNVSGEEAILHIPLSHSGQSGQSSLLVHRDIAESREVRVQTVSLDDYLGGIEKGADFMKIDVEGLEILAFRGMKHILQSLPPQIIISEVSDLPDCLASQNELISYLAQYRYLPFIIKRDGLALYKPGDVLEAEYYNFAFVQPGALPLVKSLVKSG